MLPNSKIPTILSLLLLVIGTITIWIFTLLAILNNWPLSLQNFFSLFGALTMLNLIFLFAFYKTRNSFSVEKQIAVIIWGSIAVWYWLFAPIYFVLNLNFSQLQLKFAAFEFSWEVPVLGIIFTLISILAFKPIANYLKYKQVSDREKLYKATLRYPQVIATLIFLITILGYVLGGLQSTIFAYLPTIEYIKTVWEGVVISLFLAVTLYLFFDLFLEKIRGKIEHNFKIQNIEKRSITTKIFGVATAVIIGSFSLFSLSVFQSSQTLIKDNIINHIEDVLPQVKYALSNARTNEEYNVALGSLLMGPNSAIFYIDQPSEIKNLNLSEETKKFIENNKEGFTEDFKNEIKVIAIFQNPTTNHKIITNILLSDFYGPLIDLLKFFILSTFFILTLSIGVLTLLSFLLSRSIKKLTDSIVLAKNTSTPYISPEIYTADEIESLSRAFSHYVQESRGLYKALQDKIKDLETANNKIAEEKSADEAMLKSIGEGLIATNEKGEITLTNSTALTLLNLDHDKTMNQHFNALFKIKNEKNEELSLSENPIQLALSSGKNSYSNNLFCATKNNLTIPVSITTSPIILAQKIIGSICVFRDITKEKEIEKSKNEFVILASHQLRTPLSTVKWYTETILRRFSKTITKTHKEYLTEIYEAILRMVDLVNALLNVSRIDLGTFPIDLKLINLSNVAESVINGLSEEFKLKNINFAKNF